MQKEVVVGREGTFLPASIFYCNNGNVKPGQYLGWQMSRIGGLGQERRIWEMVMLQSRNLI